MPNVAGKVHCPLGGNIRKRSPGIEPFPHLEVLTDKGVTWADAMMAAQLADSGIRQGMAKTATDDDDRALIARIAANRDTGAFERLYHDYRRRLGPFMYRFVNDPGANEESFNDIMLTVWNKASAYNGNSKVSTWIFSIAYRQCLKTLRSARKNQATEPLPDNLVAESGGADSQDLVSNALSQLSAEHRLVIELSYFVGHTYQEIAEIADCPENTVKTRVFHARRRLKNIMRELGERPASRTSQ